MFTSLIVIVIKQAEANLQGLVKEVAAMQLSSGRRTVNNAVIRQILTAASEGPKATDQFSAVAAAFVSVSALSYPPLDC